MAKTTRPVRWVTASTVRSWAVRMACLTLAEGLLDWIEVAAVGRQEPEPCAGRADQAPGLGALVGAEIVHWPAQLK